MATCEYGAALSGAPEFGEQTDEILREIGYAQEDITQFRKTGPIQAR
jgi:crotonobetainyl-CoA:carnitine CoA-transferase CaiB-like acyl-CoA transferase